MDQGLRKVFENAKKSKEVAQIILQETAVVKRYGPIFSSVKVSDVSEEDFRGFLKFENNQHWTTLERQKNRLTSDMVVLREKLTVLVDEARPISDRVDEVLTIKGMGKGTLSAILMVAYPDRYGVWNGTSEVGLLMSGLWPEIKSGATLGQQYEAINRVLLKTAEELGVSLWVLDSLWWNLDVSGLDIEPAVKKRVKKGSNSKSSISNSFSKSVWMMKSSVLKTVSQSNGQEQIVVAKNKLLKMNEIELEQIISELLRDSEGKCAITGIGFELEGEGKDLDLRPSLDRIDSDGHYELGNLQIVCRFVNFWKQSTDDSKFRELIELVCDNQSERQDV